MRPRLQGLVRWVPRWVALVFVAWLALELFFVGRIAIMTAVAPQSTTFQRSEAARLLREKGTLRWRQQWVPYGQIADTLKRAVIASEDDGFASHDGVEWDAIEKAWQKNAKAQEQAARKAPGPGPRKPPAKIVGGSTITQQLAKNLLLSGERTLLRKGQELVLTMALETLLDKERILEIYLNHVEWGEGVFGAEAAARHYYRKSAAQLTSWEAARLAVMLPAPKRYERLASSAYLSSRAAPIQARMGDAVLP